VTPNFEIQWDDPRFYGDWDLREDGEVHLDGVILVGLDHHRLSLAGLSEAHSVRGTRALYDRSQPGLIVQALAATL
jgi:hypothetical protein